MTRLVPGINLLVLEVFRTHTERNLYKFRGAERAYQSQGLRKRYNIKTKRKSTKQYLIYNKCSRKPAFNKLFSKLQIYWTAVLP